MISQKAVFDTRVRKHLTSYQEGTHEEGVGFPISLSRSALAKANVALASADIGLVGRKSLDPYLKQTRASERWVYEQERQRRQTVGGLDKRGVVGLRDLQVSDGGNAEFGEVALNLGCLERLKVKVDVLRATTSA